MDLADWSARAAEARAALVAHYWDPRRGRFRPAPGLPGRLRASLPGAAWHPWWQAHALDVLCDGVQAGDADAADLAIRLVAGLSRGLGPDLTRSAYVDDLAWLGLATWRAHTLGVLGSEVPLALARAVLVGHDPVLGGFRWRFGDDYHNVPATAPAAMLLAHTAAAAGEPGWLAVARDGAEWLHDVVVGPDGLVRDGARPRGGTLAPEGPLWSYNVGTVAGLDVVLADHDPEPARAGERLDRAASVLRVGTRALAGPDGTWRDERHDGTGPDPQLFRGILARHLAARIVAAPHGAGDLAAVLRTQAEAVWAARDRYGRVSATWRPSRRRGAPSLAAHLSGVLVLAAAARATG
jgi:predicted alpha-1,6-mannanase (GH76 family)